MKKKKKKGSKGTEIEIFATQVRVRESNSYRAVRSKLNLLERNARGPGPGAFKNK